MDVWDDDGSNSSDDFVEDVALKPTSVARIVELAREYCNAKQWGEWLSVPLEHAAADGDQELAEELVLAGAFGDSISAAMKCGQNDLVDHLLQLDYGPTDVLDHHLHLAVELEDEHFVALFLSRGLKPEKDCLLRAAAALGNDAVVSLLLKHGANPNDSQQHLLWAKEYLTPVLITAKEGHASMLRLLLDAGASAGRRLSTDQPVDDWTGYDQRYTKVQTESALDHAAMKGHVNVIKTIIERDPSLVNSVAECTGKTALLYAAKHHQVDAIDALVEAGADLDVKDKDGHAPLHVAAELPGGEATLRVLLKHGAKLNVVGYSRLTPLCVAVGRGDVVAANVLISAGADVNTSLLSVSGVSDEHSTVMIRILLRHDADVNTRRVRDGSSPLHLALMHSVEENVKVLLAAGGDETAVNCPRKPPADVVGAECRTFESLLRETGPIRALLAAARMDRSRRLRVFFLLCRKVPDRWRLYLAPSGTESSEDISPASAACDHLAIVRSHKKAAKANKDDHTDKPARATCVALSAAKNDCDFVAAMGQLLGFQADVVFSTVMEFV